MSHDPLRRLRDPAGIGRPFSPRLPRQRPSRVERWEYVCPRGLVIQMPRRAVCERVACPHLLSDPDRPPRTECEFVLVARRDVALEAEQRRRDEERQREEEREHQARLRTQSDARFEAADRERSERLEAEFEARCERRRSNPDPRGWYYPAEFYDQFIDPEEVPESYEELLEKRFDAMRRVGRRFERKRRSGDEGDARTDCGVGEDDEREDEDADEDDDEEP